MQIKSDDISVVVQGVIDKDTRKCLKSIRKYLPHAEIILSTWRGSDLEGLDYDILVENDDPGAVLLIKETKYYYNINRQLVSTQNGIKKASRKYILKIRTDSFLKGNLFLEFFDKFNKYDTKYKCFEHRIIVPTIYSRESSAVNTKMKTPLHPSDFYFFGLTEDIRAYFENTKLMKQSDMRNYPYLNKEKIPFNNLTFRFPPEQYFCLSFALQHFPDIKFEDWSDWDEDLCEFSKHFLYNNFIFLGMSEFQIYNKKHRKYQVLDDRITKGLITYKKFLDNYRQMFDENYKEYNSFKYTCSKIDNNLQITKYLIYIILNNTIDIIKNLYYQFM